MLKLDSADNLKEIIILAVVTIIIIFAFNPILSAQFAYNESIAFGPSKSLLYLLQIITGFNLDLVFLWLSYIFVKVKMQ
jgi:hypothetical protein